MGQNNYYLLFFFRNHLIIELEEYIGINVNEIEVDKVLKGLLDKIFKPTQQTSQQKTENISQADVEAIIDAKLKEHAAAIQSTNVNQQNQKTETNRDDYKLTAKQLEFALSLIAKVSKEFKLVIDPSELTVKDLNRLIAYQRYGNKGTLINLVKNGVLKKI
ncbi:ABC transporter ATP-binding protein [Bacillus sp. DTU_2020_1000418_1_SI_GHA_SEK_038]|uniref:ABC transporter ATP-binding protein n=1 Tax=Bacillus sp. DTU_2020_1000418_1_SI_GHA_SEK_038 TaxID=3077585 RepID=UPI0028ED4534|nr:ABC transporter ATP-binding protein [Bacillus sp. DTU_2020_1000418_1_SI_GHA_SEK_038]WNS73672.1 ABC transporter ATP-binding protein [Bacillus sp. DTU_2020_1000418_1_SI_GHA_SEK_038]